jgi:hypothetical protein
VSGSVSAVTVLQASELTIGSYSAAIVGLPPAEVNVWRLAGANSSGAVGKASERLVGQS